MKKDKWVKYRNGNYTVRFNLSDGTKIRETNDDEFIPNFAENIDVTITHKCNGGCSFCYLNCTEQGKHADLMSAKWVDTLHPFTELALNGNDMSHPQLIPFLKKLRDKQVIANMTVNQMHFEEYYDAIMALLENHLIHGLGISLQKPTPDFIRKVQKIPTAVIHVINGICTEQDFKVLANHGLTVLILGYKDIKRGATYHAAHNELISKNQQWTYNNLQNITKWFKIVSFDNLALKQLEVKRIMSDKDWNEFYMGDDGGFTHALDMVDGTFAKSSLSTENFPIMDNAEDMFKFIQKKYGKKN